MRFTATNGVLLAAPHVVGFALGPRLMDPFPQQCLRPPLCMMGNCNQHTLQPVDLLRSSKYVRLDDGQGCLRRKKSRRRPFCATSLSASSSSSAATESPTPMIVATPAGSLSLVIIGACADSLGFQVGEHYGFSVKSIDELLEGRRGRKTDNVKVKVILKWITGEQAPGNILTGFPETVEQAELLRSQGILVESFVVVKDPAEQPVGSEKDDLAQVRETWGFPALTKHMKNYSKVEELWHERDMDKLVQSAFHVLELTERRPEIEIQKTFVTPGSTEMVSGRLEEVLPPTKERRGDFSDGYTKLEEQDDSLASQLTTMSPSEQLSAQKRDPQAYETAVREAKTSGEIKRAKKELIKQKKRAANEAQKLDTPFYLAVSSGNHKSRVRQPIQTVPSRITEKLSSAYRDEEGAINKRIDFGPLVLDSPTSDCLLAAGITKPTGIQQAGMGPVLNGESVILHSMTGSGKTLAFLLPLMKRWAPSFSASRALGEDWRTETANRDDRAFRVLIALPTRELAVQVAREVVLLSGGFTAAVELLVDSAQSHDLSKITAPIVVGSAKTLERAIRKSRPRARDDMLSRVECIVVDEVDRLVDVLPRHAPPREAEKRKKHTRPIAALLERVLQSKPGVQVVGCSATIGRPLRREMAHIVNAAAAKAAAAAAASEHAGAGSVNHSRHMRRTEEFTVIRDPFLTSPGSLSTKRAVPIPDTIRHYCVTLIDGGFFSRLEALAAAVRELQPCRPLVFVPPDERVTAVVAHLKRAGGEVGKSAVALHEAMGFGSDEDEDGVRGKHSSEAIEQHDKLTGQFRGKLSASGIPRNDKGSTILSRPGVSNLMADKGGPILVTSEDTARGLHFDDIDVVFLMQKPKSPDEYVHLAGRTGRRGKAGSVVSIVTFDEWRKLRSWGTSLKVDFEKMNSIVTDSHRN